MTLSSMVVSRDWQEVSVLECILGSLHMDVAVESEPQRALSRLTSSKIDALIVDCDLNGTGQLCRELQQEAPLANTVPLLIMGRSPCTPEAHSTGAIYAFDKPISVEQDRKSTRLNSSHLVISYAVFCLKKKKTKQHSHTIDIKKIHRPSRYFIMPT